jgi:hypothetical protein
MIPGGGFAGGYGLLSPNMSFMQRWPQPTPFAPLINPAMMMGGGMMAQSAPGYGLMPGQGVFPGYYPGTGYFPGGGYSPGVGSMGTGPGMGLGLNFDLSSLFSTASYGSSSDPFSTAYRGSRPDDDVDCIECRQRRRPLVESIDLEREGRRDPLDRYTEAGLRDVRPASTDDDRRDRVASVDDVDNPPPVRRRPDGTVVRPGVNEDIPSAEPTQPPILRPHNPSEAYAQKWPVWTAIKRYWPQCAEEIGMPSCIPYNYHSQENRGGRSCHNSGRAADIHAMDCDGHIYWAINNGPFERMVMCMKRHMTVLWHFCDPSFSSCRTATEWHRDHGHFSIGCGGGVK